MVVNLLRYKKGATEGAKTQVEFFLELLYCSKLYSHMSTDCMIDLDCIACKLTYDCPNKKVGFAYWVLDKVTTRRPVFNFETKEIARLLDAVPRATEKDILNIQHIIGDDWSLPTNFLIVGSVETCGVHLYLKGDLVVERKLFETDDRAKFRFTVLRNCREVDWCLDHLPHYSSIQFGRLLVLDHDNTSVSFSGGYRKSVEHVIASL